MEKKPGIFSSPKTTWAALLALVAIVAVQLGYVFDADPLTTFDFGVVIPQILILFGLSKARDNDKSSEDVGAKPDENKTAPTTYNSRNPSGKSY